MIRNDDGHGFLVAIIIFIFFLLANKVMANGYELPEEKLSKIPKTTIVVDIPITYETRKFEESYELKMIVQNQLSELGFTVVTSRDYSLGKILSEREIQGTLGIERARSIGQISGADFILIIHPKITKAGDFSISAEIIEVNSGLIVMSDHQEVESLPKESYAMAGLNVGITAEYNRNFYCLEFFDQYRTKYDKCTEYSFQLIKTGLTITTTYIPFYGAFTAGFSFGDLDSDVVGTFADFNLGYSYKNLAFFYVIAGVGALEPLTVSRESDWQPYVDGKKIEKIYGIDHMKSTDYFSFGFGISIMTIITVNMTRYQFQDFSFMSYGAGISLRITGDGY